MKKLTLFLSMMIALVGLNANAAMYIVGSGPFGNWNPAGGVEMTDNGDGTYSYTVAVNGDVFFVFADGQNSDWNTFNNNYRYGPANGDTPVSAGDWIATAKAGDNGAYIFTGSGDDYVFTFDETNHRFKITGYVAPFSPLTGKLFTLGQVNGNNWNPSTGIEMATTDENVFTLTDATITDSGDGYGYFSFTTKLGENADDWGFSQYRRGSTQDGFEAVNGVKAEMGAWGTSYAFKALPAIYDITVNLSEGSVLLTKKGDIVPETTDVYIFGDVNDFSTADGWDATKGAKMTETDGIYTAEVTANKREGQEYAYFGFTKKLAETNDSIGWASIAPYRFGPMSDGAFVMTEELLGKTCELDLVGDYAQSIAIPEGTWTVTVDLTNGTFKIDGEWPHVEHYDGDVFILGGVNGNGWEPSVGVKMNRDAENNLYTATITTNGSEYTDSLGISYNYFSFTKMLAETAGDWDAIAPYRFGAVSEGDFWVTDEILGQNIKLTAPGQSFKIPVGEWNLTLSVDNMTLVITKVEGLRGDVDNNKEVGIADVSALIDYLLTGDASAVNLQNADCNVDTEVGIADVSALIDYLLSGNWAE